MSEHQDPWFEWLEYTTRWEAMTPEERDALGRAAESCGCSLEEILVEEIRDERKRKLAALVDERRRRAEAPAPEPQRRQRKLSPEAAVKRALKRNIPVKSFTVGEVTLHLAEPDGTGAATGDRNEWDELVQ
jgi:hypothetical protein